MSKGFKLAPTNQKEIEANITVDGKKLDLGTEGGGSLKTIDEFTHLLEELIVELRINNYILNEVHDMDVTEEDLT